MNQIGTDQALQRLAHLVSGLRYEQVPVSARKAAILRVADTLGCAMGAYTAPSCTVGRTLAMRAPCIIGGAILLGTRYRALPELAAFANGLMARNLDGNDTFLAGGGHPSDIVSAVLAMADSVEADGAQLISAVVAAYEAYFWVFRAANVRDSGWDHSLYSAVGAAAGACAILGLDVRKTYQALSIAITANHGLLVTRRGNLSQWKSCASPYAARDGIMCALLAAEGITGPESPLRGSSGLFDHFGPTSPAMMDTSVPFAVEKSDLKPYLCFYHAQTPVEVAIRLHGRLAGEEIQSVEISIYAATGLSEDTSEKWNPSSRETADHSLPFIVASVLHDGRFSDVIFSDDRLRDPRIHLMMDKIQMRFDDVLTLSFPEKTPCSITIVTSSGRVLEEHAEFAKGHRLNPFTVEEVGQKFRRLAGRVLSPNRAASAMELILEIDKASTVGPLMEELVVDQSM